MSPDPPLSPSVRVPAARAPGTRASRRLRGPTRSPRPTPGRRPPRRKSSPPAPPTQVAISATPGSATASNQTNIKLSLQLEDSLGNPTTSVGTTTLTLSTASSKGFFATASGASGTLGGTGTVTFAPGAGTATEWYGDETSSSSRTISATQRLESMGEYHRLDHRGQRNQVGVHERPHHGNRVRQRQPRSLHGAAGGPVRQWRQCPERRRVGGPERDLSNFRPASRRRRTPAGARP